MIRIYFFLISFLGSTPFLSADTVSALFGRGYTVIPEPQRVTLRADGFRFGSEWRLQAGTGIAVDSPVLAGFADDLKTRFQVGLTPDLSARSVILLEVAPDSVAPGPSQDRDRGSIVSQAYRIELSPSRIRISANAAPGLFYGTQTLLQLLKPRDGSLWLPEGEIVDWPDLGLRQIYWDDAHHLEHLSDLEAAVRQAAFFKINGFLIKLEGHFQYRSAPALVEPQALSPADFQSLTDYGLRYHVQVIPYLDAPGHIAFILKHPEYANIREFPASNYELCAINPDALKLMYGMYDDLIAANKGVKYFYLSTDEAYYAGLAASPECNEAARAKELGSVGKVLAEFVTKAANYLHDRGRTVVFWGEYPLKPDDIASLPSHIVNGETYGPEFDPVFKTQGIRQMIYGATEGEERLFPHYFLRPLPRRLHPLYEDIERVPDALSKIAAEPARRTSDLMGIVIAGWGDMGLHPETFWLGYATITAAGWRPWSVDAREAMSAFYPLFYGPSVSNMGRVYQLMSYQAQAWSDSWETVNSTSRKPIWGNSYKIFNPPQPAKDQVIALPPVPASGSLRYPSNWSQENAPRLRMAAESLAENDELVDLVNMNMRLASRNRYGLELFLAIARICRQNLTLLLALQEIDKAFVQADKDARTAAPKKALQSMDRALAAAREIRTQRNTVLRDATATWYKTWLPRVPEANGRRFLHAVDDVKDHLPDRTVDMSYLVYRELLLPFDDWYQRTESVRNSYAEAHHLPASHIPLAWKELQ